VVRTFTTKLNLLLHFSSFVIVLDSMLVSYCMAFHGDVFLYSGVCVFAFEKQKNFLRKFFCLEHIFVICVIMFLLLIVSVICISIHFNVITVWCARLTVSSGFGSTQIIFYFSNFKVT